ncbi:hypothetical protein C8R44DRAFT_733197 [Mycena epipterygia]|nr:hypothetical protein C8R44DRAFT_733197 [Mycena epipterygia]
MDFTRPSKSRLNTMLGSTTKGIWGNMEVAAFPETFENLVRLDPLLHALRIVSTGSRWTSWDSEVTNAIAKHHYHVSDLKDQGKTQLSYSVHPVTSSATISAWVKASALASGWAFALEFWNRKTAGRINRQHQLGKLFFPIIQLIHIHSTRTIERPPLSQTRLHRGRASVSGTLYAAQKHNRHQQGSTEGVLAIWNLNPRSSHTPVRERTALEGPPHLFRTRPITEVEPATPTPLPHSKRNLERLPSLEFGPASRSFEGWFHTGIFEDTHEDGSEVGQEE